MFHAFLYLPAQSRTDASFPNMPPPIHAVMFNTKFKIANPQDPDTYSPIVSNETDDIVVNPPNNPTKIKALIMGSKSML
jgi:hypothetical protein